MKSLILFLVLFLGVNSGYSQHLSYLGIPIDNSIEVFSDLLVQKGFKLIDDKTNSSCFVGIVLNDTVFTVVDYSYKSKTVYRVSQMRYTETEFERNTYLSSMKKLYSKKYGDNASTKYGENMLIISENDEEIGYIGFRTFDHDDSYNVTITFSDDKNYDLNDKEKISDL